MSSLRTELFCMAEVTVDVHVMCSAMDIQRSWRFNQRLRKSHYAQWYFSWNIKELKRLWEGGETEVFKVERTVCVKTWGTGELEHWADPSEVKEQEWGRNNKEQAYSRRQGLARSSPGIQVRSLDCFPTAPKVTKAEGLTGSDFHFRIIILVKCQEREQDWNQRKAIWKLLNKLRPEMVVASK